MKMSMKRFRRLLMEEIQHVLDEERPEDVEPLEDLWAGGENVHLDIDHSEAGGGEAATVEHEVMDIVGESYGAASNPLDPSGDGMLTPEELYNHFDLDGDGVVTVDDYISHVKWHCEHPDAFEKEMAAPIGDDVMMQVLQGLGIL